MQGKRLQLDLTLTSVVFESKQSVKDACKAYI